MTKKQKCLNAVQATYGIWKDIPLPRPSIVVRQELIDLVSSVIDRTEYASTDEVMEKVDELIASELWEESK